MEKLILQMLIFLSSLIVLLVLSVPLHELFHVLTIKIFGGKFIGKNKITWLKLHFQVSRKGIQEIGIGGGGKLRISLPDYSKKHLKRVVLLIHLSGGLGTAIVLIGIAFLFSFPGILSWIEVSLIIIGSLHLTYSIFVEAADSEFEAID